MKIVICTKPGGAGKTTLTAHLVARHLPSAAIFAVDTSNQTVKELGLNAEIYDALQFREIFEKIFHLEDAVLDVGGSKIFDEFYSKLKESENSHIEFDYFLVPVIPNEKAETETVEVIVKLLAAKIPPEKIRIIYNNVEALSSFTKIPALATKTGIRTVKVLKSAIYGLLADLKKTIDAVDKDPKTAADYKKLAQAQKNGTVEFKKMFNNYYVKGMVGAASKQLADVWAELDLK